MLAWKETELPQVFNPIGLLPIRSSRCGTKAKFGMAVFFTKRSDG